MMKTCNKCGKEKPKSEFPKNKTYKDGFNVTCKVCKRAIDKSYRDKKKEDPVWWNKELTRLRNRNRFYVTGFTTELFDQRLEEQGGRCAICGTTDPGATNWHADHCHETKQPRGVLCKKCNTGIGMLNDNIEIVEAALRYLQHYTR